MGNSYFYVIILVDGHVDLFLNWQLLINGSEVLYTL